MFRKGFRLRNRSAPDEFFGLRRSGGSPVFPGIVLPGAVSIGTRPVTTREPAKKKKNRAAGSQNRKMLFLDILFAPGSLF